eukprot:7926836-Pyramimonas_sp.AAC.1
MAALRYEAALRSTAPHALQQARRRYAQALRGPWPGRCLATHLAVEGADPACTIMKKLFTN